MRRALFIAALMAFAGCLETSTSSEIFANGTRVEEMLPVEPFPVPVPTPAPPPSPPSIFPPPSPPLEPPVSSNITSILLNGGFEDGDGRNAQGWEVDESPPGTSPTGRFCSVSRSGECALALGRPARGALARQDVTIQGTEHTLAATFWARDATDVPRTDAWFHATLGALDANGVVLASDTLTFEGDAPREDWSFEKLGPFRAPEGTVAARLWFETHPSIAPGDASQSALVTYLDDIALHHTRSPAFPFSNGGFEDGEPDDTNPWGRNDGATHDCGVARSGACSVRLPHESGASVSMSIGVFGETLRIRHQSLSQGASMTDAPMTRLNVTFYAEDGSTLASYGGGSTAFVEGWASHEVGPIDVPTTTYKVHFVFEAGRAPVVITWIDDVTLEWS